MLELVEKLGLLALNEVTITVRLLLALICGGAVFVHRQRLRESAVQDGVSHIKKTAGRYRSAFLFPYVSLM